MNKEKTLTVMALVRHVCLGLNRYSHEIRRKRNKRQAPCQNMDFLQRHAEAPSLESAHRLDGDHSVTKASKSQERCVGGTSN